MDTTIRSRIEALLAKAEDPACSPAEAELYNGKAAELMAKYAIDRALQADREPRTDQVLNKWYVFDAPYALDKLFLMSCIADALRCQKIRTRRAPRLRLFGFQSDIERVELLFGSLSLQAASGVRRVSAPAGANTTSHRKSWLLGFSHAVHKRLKLAEQNAADAATSSTGRSTELVLLDRSALVEDEFRRAYPKTQQGTRRKLRPGGYSSGYQAGERADLGSRTTLGGDTPPRIGR